MDLTRTGKYLSLILRHKPEAAGITLDEHGWADVEELVKAVPVKYLEKIGHEKKKQSRKTIHDAR